jgi:lipopolysaccharide biosynthesis regulator YciM
MPSETWIDSGTIEAPKKMDLALAWVKQNRETFIGAIVIALAVGIFAVYFFLHYRDLRETAWKNLFMAQQTGYGGNMPQAQTLLAEIETTYGRTTAAPYATLTKGDMLFAQGKFKEAGAEYAKITARPENLAPFALYNLGKCKEAEGDLAGAQAQYADLLSKYPEHFMAPEAHYALARTQELAGSKDMAKATYEKIVLLYPETSWATQAKARLTASEQKTAAKK